MPSPEKNPYLQFPSVHVLFCFILCIATNKRAIDGNQLRTQKAAVVIVTQEDCRLVDLHQGKIIAFLRMEGSVAERFKTLTRNSVVPSSSPLLAGHAGVNSLLASLPASWGF